MPAFRERTALLLVLCLAAFLRLYQFSTLPPGLYPDEAMNGNNALEALETHQFRVFYPENFGREGLYVNVAAVFIHFFGHTAWALRLPSAFFGILTVCGVYFLAKELFTPAIGLLASFFLATSFWHVNFSRIAFRAIAAPVFLAWALYLLLIALRFARERRPTVVVMLLAGLVYGLGFYTYIAYRVTPVLVGGILLHHLLHAHEGRWKPTGAFLLAAMAAGGPLLVYFVRNPGTFFGRTSQLSVFSSPNPFEQLALNTWKTALMFFFSGDANWRHNYSGRPELFWPVAILLAAGVGVAIGSFKSGARFAYGVPLGWLLLAALPVIFSNESLPHALRAILMAPPAFILAAAGARAAYDYLSPELPRGVRIPVLVLFFAALAWEPYHTYFELWATDPNVPPGFAASLTKTAEEINALPKEVPKYVAFTSRIGMENGVPLAAQPVMFLTGSYTKRGQAENRIHYLTPESCGHVAVPSAEAKVFCVE